MLRRQKYLPRTIHTKRIPKNYAAKANVVVVEKRKQTYKLLRDAPITLLSALNLLFTVTFSTSVNWWKMNFLENCKSFIKDLLQNKTKCYFNLRQFGLSGDIKTTCNVILQFAIGTLKQNKKQQLKICRKTFGRLFFGPLTSRWR